MNAAEQARQRWDSIAKPLHSLGRLEDLVAQIAGIQGTPDVRIDPRGKGVCPLVRQSQDVLFSHRFLHRVRRVGQLLCRDDRCRAYLLRIQQEIAQQQAFEAHFSAK